MLKIFGCFRSFDGARIFVRIRRRLSTVKKQGHNALQAMTMLFVDHVAGFHKAGMIGTRR
jgi:transposase